MEIFPDSKFRFVTKRECILLISRGLLCEPCSRIFERVWTDIIGRNESSILVFSSTFSDNCFKDSNPPCAVPIRTAATRLGSGCPAKVSDLVGVVRGKISLCTF